MTYIHSVSFFVRHYECDAESLLRPSVLLGYCQEAAFDASSVVGFSARRYAEIGYQWFAYETDLTLVRSLQYGETVTIKTWIEDFRRVRSLRRYDLRVNGELVAQAATDWVFINAQTGAPSTIPAHVVEAYQQGDTQAGNATPLPEVLPREPQPPFPKTPHADEVIFTTRRVVELRDLDPAGHVNNAVYLQYTTETERLALAAHGIRYSGVLRTKRWFIEYKLAAKLDDELEISTWSGQVITNAQRRYYIIKRISDDKVIARIQTTL